MVHNPFINTEIKDTTIIASEEAKIGIMDNLTDGKGNINFVPHKQIFNLYRNLRVFLHNNPKKLYLIFQLLEKPAPKGVLKGEGFEGFEKDDTTNLGQLEYELKGYGVFELTTDDFKVLHGEYTIPLFAPGLRFPPYNYEKKAKKMDDRARLTFKILPNPYDDEDVKREYRKYLKLNPLDTKENQLNEGGKKDGKKDEEKKPAGKGIFYFFRLFALYQKYEETVYRQSV